VHTHARQRVIRGLGDPDRDRPGRAASRDLEVSLLTDTQFNRLPPDRAWS
jgi:hypothetical protein